LTGVRFLMQFDLPTSDAHDALADLRRMGITRTRLLPSGAYCSRFSRTCRTLRGRFEHGDYCRATPGSESAAP
jgi:hypothetical protein